MPVVCAIETYEQIVDDLRPLLIEHWREIALYEDIPLDPDWAFYETLAASGTMAIYSVRLDGALIGYAVYFGRPHPHYRSALWAVSDIFWLHPDHRSAGVGRGLFEFIEADLRAKGVAVMHTTTKREHPMASLLLQSLGHAKVEVGHSKRLT